MQPVHPGAPHRKKNTESAHIYTAHLKKSCLKDSQMFYARRHIYIYLYMLCSKTTRVRLKREIMRMTPFTLSWLPTCLLPSSFNGRDNLKHTTDCFRAKLLLVVSADRFYWVSSSFQRLTTYLFVVVSYIFIALLSKAIVNDKLSVGFHDMF